MKFKFYHGTSSIFLSSIKKHGLGGINPNIDLKNLEVLKFLKDLSEKNLLNNSEYLKLRETTIAMANQNSIEITDLRGNKILLNYKHDGIFLALSLERAVIYASLNKYGSEILERCINLYNILIENKITFEIPNEINLFGIEKYLNYEHRPIIIEINDIDDNDLENEYGNNAKKTLDKLRKDIPNMSEKKKFELLQYINFKLLKPIHIDKMKIYELDFEGYPNDKNFEYTLSRIN